jgi:hypothetical protein
MPFCRTIDHGSNTIGTISIFLFHLPNTLLSFRSLPVYAATNSALMKANGKNFEDFKDVLTSAESQEEDKQERLWQLSEQLTD